VSSDETPVRVLKRELETLQRGHANVAKLLEILKDLPEERSIEIVKQLRLPNADIASLVYLGVGDTLDITPLLRQVLFYPPTRGGLEFELMIRHAIAYPTLVPLDIASGYVMPLSIPGSIVGTGL